MGKTSWASLLPGGTWATSQARNADLLCNIWIGYTPEERGDGFQFDSDIYT